MNVEPGFGSGDPDGPSIGGCGGCAEVGVGIDFPARYASAVPRWMMYMSSDSSTSKAVRDGQSPVAVWYSSRTAGSKTVSQSERNDVDE